VVLNFTKSLKFLVNQRHGVRKVEIGSVEDFNGECRRPPLRNVDVVLLQKYIKVFGLLRLLCRMRHVEVDLTWPLRSFFNVVVLLADLRVGSF